jgi:hypothetical protein
MESVFMTREEMANNYRICVRTLNSRLADKGIVLNKGLISPKDQELIYSILGFPSNYTIIKRDRKF